MKANKIMNIFLLLILVLSVAAVGARADTGNTTQEEADYNNYHDDFYDLKDDYQTYKNKYLNALRADEDNEAERYRFRLKDIDDDLGDLQDDAEDLADDLRDLNERDLLGDTRDLIDKIENLRDDISDLIDSGYRTYSGNGGAVFHSASDYYGYYYNDNNEYNQMMNHVQAEESQPAMIVQNFQMPSSFDEPAVKVPAKVNNGMELVWMIAGIFILLALIIFLVAVALR